MGISTLRQLLQSLCCDSPWNYAVFWKIHNRSQVISTWEDGYFDNPRPRESMGSIFDDFPIEGLDEILSSRCESSIYENSVGYPIGLAVDITPSDHGVPAEWVVNEVAHTGKHRWILSDDFLSGDLAPYLFPQCPDEHLQLVLGIKTIVLIPLLPYGVLQIGSLGKVAEDPSLISSIKDKFYDHQFFHGDDHRFPPNTKILSPSTTQIPMSPTITYQNSCHFPAPNKLEIIETDTFNFPPLREEQAFSSYSYGDNMGMIEEYGNELGNNFNHCTMINDYNMGCRSIDSSFCFPEVSELHKALGPAFFSEANQWEEEANIGTDNHRSGNLIANTFVGSNDNSSNVLSFTTSSAFNEAAATGTMSYPSASSFESMMSVLTEEKQQQDKGSYYCDQTHKGGSKHPITSKRRVRARPGEGRRPRPRDRQMIQDRVKELRELVPDGAKCSIDGLLDQTIKHMLFLRSVTEQADKLRKSVRKERKRSSERKGNKQKGASWAFELGTDNQVCPIIVEDLEYPGHMLIEMLCNDHGHFFEIAGTIRRMDLTILKGVMERRSDHTWAHFVVEASTGFRRLDIFWPLLRLIQQTPSAVSGNV